MRRWQLMPVLSCKRVGLLLFGPLEPFIQPLHCWLIQKVKLYLIMGTQNILFNRAAHFSRERKERVGRREPNLLRDIILHSYGKGRWLKKKQMNNNSPSDNTGWLHVASLPRNRVSPTHPSVSHSILGATGKIPFSLIHPATASVASSLPSQGLSPHRTRRSGLEAARQRHGRAPQSTNLSGKRSCNGQTTGHCSKGEMSTLGSKTVSPGLQKIRVQYNFGWFRC